MRIQIDDNSAALTPYGSLVSAVARSKRAGKPWTITFQADRSDRQALPAALVTAAMIVIILIAAENTHWGQRILGRAVPLPATVRYLACL
jgi:hypothetical protein